MRGALLACALLAAAPAFARTFDVMAYGAKGDGRADDSAAIERTMAAADEAGGGRVHLPAGRYRARVVVRSGIELAGDGAGATVIVAPESRGYADNSYAGFGRLVSSVTVRGLSVEADVARSSWAAGIRFAGSSGVRVEDVTVTGSQHGQGIVFDEAPGFGSDNLVLGCTVKNSSQGIVVDNENARVIGNVVEGCKYGISMEYATPHAAVVSGNIVDGRGRSGSVGIIASAADSAVVSGNSVRGVDLGLYLKEGPSRMTVESNSVFDAAVAGIRLDGGSFNAIRGNSVHGAKGRGIRLEDSVDSEVSGNFVTDSGREGILLLSVSRTRVWGNRIVRAGAAGVSISGGADNDISGNSFSRTKDHPKALEKDL